MVFVAGKKNAEERLESPSSSITGNVGAPDISRVNSSRRQICLARVSILDRSVRLSNEGS
jgi:hypothetical protein